MSSPKSPSKKKSSTKKKSSSKKSHSSPNYLKQIVAAIGELKVRGGASRQAITAYITENHKGDKPIQKGVINRALKKGVEGGVLANPAGHSHTFRVASKTARSRSKSPAASKKKKRRI